MDYSFAIRRSSSSSIHEAAPSVIDAIRKRAHGQPLLRTSIVSSAPFQRLAFISHLRLDDSENERNLSARSPLQ